MKNQSTPKGILILLFVFCINFSLFQVKNNSKNKIKNNQAHPIISSIAKNGRLLFVTLSTKKRRTTPVIYYDQPYKTEWATTYSNLPPIVNPTPAPPKNVITAVNEVTVVQNANDSRGNVAEVAQSGETTAFNQALIVQNQNQNGVNIASVNQEQKSADGLNLGAIVQENNTNNLNQAVATQTLNANGVNYSTTSQRDNTGAVNVASHTHEIQNSPLGNLAFSLGLATNGNSNIAMKSYATNSFNYEEFEKFAREFQQQTDPTVNNR